MRDPVEHALNHELRRQIIEALWHHSEPLTAERFHTDYVRDERTSVATVLYHVRQLASDGIVTSAVGDDKELSEQSRFVLEGPNSSEAIRRCPGLIGR